MWQRLPRNPWTRRRGYAALAALAGIGLIAAACGGGGSDDNAAAGNTDSDNDSGGNGTADHVADGLCTPAEFVTDADNLPVVDSKRRETTNGDTSFTITVIDAAGEPATFLTSGQCWERAVLGEVSPDAAALVAAPPSPEEDLAVETPVPISGGPGGPIEEHPGFQDRTAEVEELGRGHLEVGTPFSYPSTPPAGGPHWSIPTRCGLYAEAQAFEGFVHTMEHGAIIWYYDPAQWTPEAIDQFGELARELLNDGNRLALAPVPPNDALAQPIALAAWGHLLFLEEFEPDSIRAFVDKFKDQGPESIPRENAC